jgi:hypothetical protein
VKRGTPRHPKTTELAIALSIERWGAVGILESLWHFAQEFAKRGDVGRFTDKAIANGIGWSGDHSVIIDALCACHWLDRCPCHRLRIHDWPDHADAGVHNSSEVKSRGLLECYESLPDVPDMIDASCGVQPATAMATATAQNGNGNGSNPSTQTDETLTRFLSAFNATYSRNVCKVQGLDKLVKARLKEGFHRWQIVAIPIIGEAWRAKLGLRGKVTPEVFLRDGNHPRRYGENGTAGGRHWLRQTFQEVDQLTLSPHLAEVAETHGVLEKLVDVGIGVAQEAPGAF